MIGRASIAFVPNHARLASTLATRIALCTLRPERMTLTVDAAHLVLASIEAELALLAVRSARVALALVAVATVACQVVQRLIEVAFLRQTITRTSFILIITLLLEIKI